MPAFSFYELNEVPKRQSPSSSCNSSQTLEKVDWEDDSLFQSQEGTPESSRGDSELGEQRDTGDNNPPAICYPRLQQEHGIRSPETRNQVPVYDGRYLDTEYTTQFVEGLPYFDMVEKSANRRLGSYEKPYRIRQWQAGVAAHILGKQDVVLNSATGSGKTLCYQALLMSNVGKCIIGLCPLLSLMDDQVRSCRALGIKAAQVDLETLKANPNLLNQISRAEYEVVFFGPEFTKANNNQFKKLLLDEKSKFREQIIAIVVDEGHLCHTWRDFRPTYANLKVLRGHFPGTPILVMSATMTPTILTHAHTSLGLQTGSILCRRPVDRPNISLITIPISRGGIRTRKDLEILLPQLDNFGDPRNIPLTIIFADSRVEVCEIVDQFEELIPEHLRGVIIADYSTAISQERRKEILDGFITGGFRILVCTEAAGMGVDIPNVERVVQWKIPGFLTATAWWQRVGRCARNPNIQGLAILFYQSTLEISWAGEYPEYLQEVLLDKDPEVLLQIRAFDGSKSKRKSNRIDIEEEDTKVSKQRKQKAGTNLPNVCRALLWLVNTRGCLRLSVLHYFSNMHMPYAPTGMCCDRCWRKGQLNTSIPASKRIFGGVDISLSTAFTTHTMLDEENDRINTLFESNSSLDSDPEIIIGLGDTPSKSENPKPQRKARAAKIYDQQKSGVHEILVEYRNELWKSFFGATLSTKNRNHIPYGPDYFLDDADIETLASKALEITDAECVARVLRRRRGNLAYSTIAPYLTEIAHRIVFGVQYFFPSMKPIRVARKALSNVVLDGADINDPAVIARLAEKRRRNAEYQRAYRKKATKPPKNPQITPIAPSDDDDYGSENDHITEEEDNDDYQVEDDIPDKVSASGTEDEESEEEESPAIGEQLKKLVEPPEDLPIIVPTVFKIIQPPNVISQRSAKTRKPLGEINANVRPARKTKISRIGRAGGIRKPSLSPINVKRGRGRPRKKPNGLLSDPSLREILPRPSSLPLERASTPGILESLQADASSIALSGKRTRGVRIDFRKLADGN